VDDMLVAEKYHLNNIKKILELSCKNVSDQMQVRSISFFELQFKKKLLKFLET